MDIAPHMLAEDKPDYVRILDEALQSPHIRDALRASRGATTATQLHDRALRELPDISAGAAPEYAYYRGLREQLAQVGAGPDTDRLGSTDPAQWVEPDTPLEAAGRAGLPAMAAVLVPVLSWTSALVLWLTGLAVRAGSPTLALGRQLITAAGVLAVVGGGALVAATVGLLLTARRDSAAEPERPQPELAAEVAKARETWRAALRTRAVLPFLERELATRAAAEASEHRSKVDLVRHRPKLGFTSPGFTSPGCEGITDGSGEEKPEKEREDEVYFSSPGYSSPDFTSPDYEGPAHLSRFLPNADD
ncbi:putative intracellular protease/amidase [Streptacidiphilus sp. MAP12-20]|uniref:hypothetical protein n=1 Tax=Streptacidiphilus sp. MAP12-20 TaxID=3156299 RepID=UPI0035146886